VYYVSLKGVTGAGTLDRECRCARGRGFRYRDAATAQSIGRVADAVIGSRIIQLIELQPRDQVSNTARDF
jgi:tryptophan synthase alpha chain